ncbi:nuclear transport factor 2 family protein [Alicyclobacillus sp. SO9]|uniref:nuclear transport factor 2 family protein n=1 Tax=Alicyclobacillus sp. SO9 TaxID=2665646 RepID=UPI0018E7102A|nr:nuclear transport factor 2 family protein [Alicyclobacillus sp. SO9]QQE78333.1 nuclear transport factor 2 family protein [Alicyclobacillus sp. SO9]
MEHLINGLSARNYMEQLVKECFTEPAESAHKVADNYMAQNYTQTTDGKSVTRDEQIAHLEYVQEHMLSMEFNIQQVVYDGEWLAERHIGKSVFNDGRTVESEVSTFFRIVDGKIVETHEITRPMSNDESDRSIHTAH